MILSSENPIAKRSKALIVRALIDLLHEKPLSEISIREIAQEAVVVRQTIYRHFSSKEDILSYYLDNFYEQFVTLVTKDGHLTYRKLLVTYFQYWDDHRYIMKLLVDNNAQNLLLDYHIKYLQYAKDEAERHLPMNNISKMQQQFTIHFTAGGLWFTVKKWIEDEVALTAEEMADLILNFTKLGLDQ